MDFTLAKQSKAPIFSIPIIVYKDGGSTEYYGIGYKIIKYVNNTVKDGVNIRKIQTATWFMQFED